MARQALERPLYLPVILGTTRRGRLSAHPARFVADQLGKRAGVQTDLIDLLDLELPLDDAGEQAKQAGFAERMNRCDGLVLVSPEYNHSFSGLLKHALDTCLEEYIHKPVGVVGVSAGPFGGARGIQSFLPVARELGLVMIFTDVYFGNVEEVFDAGGALRDEAFVRRTAGFLDEMVWMATVLRRGRAEVAGPGEPEAALPPLVCPECGVTMNHHADKLVLPTSVEQAEAMDPELGGIVLEAHTCPECGTGTGRTLGRAGG
jgi:NAD(P)H-dependent FMN reductase/ribosomal protein S27AE